MPGLQSLQTGQFHKADVELTLEESVQYSQGHYIQSVSFRLGGSADANEKNILRKPDPITLLTEEAALHPNERREGESAFSSCFLMYCIRNEPYTGREVSHTKARFKETHTTVSVSHRSKQSVPT